MRHPFLGALALVLLPVVLAGCSNADVERVKSSTGLAGSLLPNGQPFGEVVENSKVCTSPKWSRREDDYKQVFVDFTCTAKTTDEINERARQRSLKELSDFAKGDLTSFGEGVERLKRMAEMKASEATRLVAAQRSRLEDLDRSIQNTEASLADPKNQELPPSWRRMAEQQLARSRMEREQVVTQAESEGVKEKAQADAAAQAAKSKLDSVVAFESRYKAAVEATSKAVMAEAQSHYAKGKAFQLRMSFKVPTERRPFLDRTEWTSEGKKLGLPDGPPNILAARDFDSTLERIIGNTIYFGAAKRFQDTVPVECPRDHFRVIETCREKS
ncbi:MAG: hypothetical protein JSR41_21850 [Proteobacteria bacterium]|nr:hypothetical protein [Pseudomonadota bacterium]